MRRLLPVAALLLGAAAPLAAQRSLAIRHFDAAIIVNPDGAIDVTETITVTFTGSWNGLYRTIPVEYRTPQGFNWTLRLDFLGATAGPEGAPLRVERSRERHYMKYKVWVPGAENATKTIQLHYRATNGLRFFEDHDELYWNITGDEWDVPLDSATAEIHLPAGVTGLRTLAFTGVVGSTAQDAAVATEGAVVRIVTTKPLAYREGLTAVVGFDKGFVRAPTEAERAAGFAGDNWPLALPVFTFLAMFFTWRKLGRDPESLPVAVQYEPPAGLTPAEAGTLLDERVDMRDITATLIALGVHGSLRIEERESQHLFGLIKNRDYIFLRLDPPAGTRRLEPHEEAVLAGVFGGQREVKLSDLEDEFYVHLDDIRTKVYQRLVERGLYRRRPDRVKGMWIAIAVVVVMLMIAAGAVIGARLGMQPFPFVAGGVVSGAIIALFARYMPARTVPGARALERVRGFEEFLGRVEGERFARIEKTPELFERFLPYAMAFGVEKKWARAFEGIFREPPRWYVGSDPMGFNATRFSNRLSALSTTAASTMSSAPRSSGGSGFSGGSSGGGGGGGGGGGF